MWFSPSTKESHLDVQEGLEGMFLLQGIHHFSVRLSLRRFLPFHCAK